MLKHLKYLSYVLRHKFFVFMECCRLGIPWRGFVHDLSKFLPDEWFPYVEFFHGKYAKARRDETGYYKPVDTGQASFDFAWLLHQNRNRHHWQWWVIPEGGEMHTQPMDSRSRREMLADWRGAGRAQGTPDTQAWYLKHRNDIVLHPDTRAWIESMLHIT